VIAHYQQLFEAHLRIWLAALPTGTLYAPMAYLMQLPAKRIRPVATLMACDLFGHPAEKALDAALAVEVFHNFTLMHDDIMDQAPLRRGQPTVHEKWNVNTAILSGDAMLVKAYQLLGSDVQLLPLFNRYALEVCEGQQLDMDFEQREDVRLEEYMEMIRLKTAVLLSCALQMGAAVAKAPVAEREKLGRMGEHLGMAFQLRDDLLDAFGDPARTGKQQGGDLRAGKRTCLLIRGLELSAAASRTELREELQRPGPERNVERMLRALEELGVRAEAEQRAREHELAAAGGLDAVDVAADAREPLRALFRLLMDRAH
jgi:geranylgeranyl diphosphate synthase, type II